MCACVCVCVRVRVRVRVRACACACVGVVVGGARMVNNDFTQLESPFEKGSGKKTRVKSY